MTKRIFGIAATLVLCLILMPGTAEALSVKVAGTELEDGYYNLENGKVATSTAAEDNYHIHFEQDSGALTLNRAEITAETNEPGILFTYESNDERAILNLIGQNTISGGGTTSYVINSKGASGNIPSSSADIEALLTINGQDNGSLTATGTAWGIQAYNLTIGGVSLDMTTGGHSALNIGRDLVIQDSRVTTKDSGDGGDFYVCRSIKFSNSTIDMREINVEFPSIYLDNNYCPEELRVSPAVVIEDSTLDIGGLKNSSLGFSLYSSYSGIDIKDSTLTAINDRMGIAAAGDSSLNISGSSTLSTGNKLAVRALNKAIVGEGTVVQGGHADGKPLVNNGEISLPAGITAEQLNTEGGPLHYYGGGTIKVGGSDVYYSVRIDPQDGTPLDELEPSWILEGSTDCTPKSPEKEGYTFTGWYTDENCTKVYDASAPLTKSLMLYAKWEVEEYTVAFNTGDGSPVEAQNVAHGGTAVKPEGDPTREGYTFTGWYTDEECTAAYDFSAPVTGNLTLYAKWDVKEYTVTFHTGDGSPVEAQNVVHGGTAAKPESDPTCEGYTFGGWYTDEACATAYDFGTPVTRDLALYAKWEAEAYTVTFNTGGGSQVEAQTVAHGGTAAKPESDPTREGCTFGGWFTDEACATAYDFGTPVTRDLTLYAKWEAEVYTVTFNTGDGSQVEAQTVVHGGTAARPKGDPTCEGYTFGGWFTDEACTAAYDFGTPVTRDLTLYAKWTAIPSQPSGGGSSSGGGGGSGSGSSTTTTTSNPDGSTTTTTKNPDGTTTTTVKQPGGTTSTTTQDPKTGAQTTVIKTPEGVSFTEERDKAGAVTQVQASVPGGAERVTLPASVDRDTALEITVQDGGSAVVEIPAEDLTPGTVAVIVAPDGSETVVRQSVSTGDGVALTVEGSAVVKLVENGKTFSDVPQTHWAAEAAAFVSARELFSGTGPDTFSPNQPMSRGMLAVVLHNLERNPAAGRTGSFTDVPDRAWYSQGVAWAAERGIISGYGDGQFGPNAPVTREQLAVILWRYAGSPAPSGSDLPFGDADQVSSWASNALRWAVENGILSGYGDGRLAPQESATRAQMAQILKRFLEQQR